jgi:hypothetical protein
MVSDKKILWEFPIGSCVKLSSAVAVILVGSLDHRTQLWKAATQGSFQQSLVEIGSVVLEEKIFIKFNTSSESSGRSAPRTFSKYIEIVSLSTTHFVLRVGFTAD